MLLRRDAGGGEPGEVVIELIRAVLLRRDAGGGEPGEVVIELTRRCYSGGTPAAASPAR